MSKRKIKRLDAATRSAIEKLLLSGFSVHQVCLKYPVSIDEAMQIQSDLAEDTRQEVINHKVLIRAQVRKALPGAINFLSQITQPQPDSPVARDLSTVSGRAVLSLRMKAAQMLLQASKEAMADNILTMMTERPMERMQDTLFDPAYRSELSSDGSIRLVVDNTAEVQDVAASE